MNQIATQELLAELDLGSARGGKAGQGREPLQVTVIRPLTAEDLPAIQAPPPVSAGLPTVKALRHSHHRLAQQLAEGRSQVEISLNTGYSESYISNLKNDPAFRELVAYYEHQRESIFVDAQDRLRVLGLDATEILHDRLHDPERPLTTQQLMDIVEMTLQPGAKPGQGGPSPGAPNSGLTLEVKFVGARAAEGPIIDVDVKES